MNKKQLTDLGISDELADQIIVLHGKDIETHKKKIETMQTEIDSVNTQLTDAGNKIAEFAKMDIDGIKKAADDYKQAAADAKKEAADSIAALKFDHALDGALSNAKAKNPKAVRALLDTKMLKFNEADESIIGLDEQLKKVKADNDYLFAAEGDEIKIVTGLKSKTVIDDAVLNSARKAAGLAEPQPKT
jgi:Phage minor structural protein GP20